MPRFAALVLPTVSWSTWIDHVRDAATAGFEHVLIDDHVINPHLPDRPWLDAWTALAAASSLVPDVRLGTLVSNVVLRSPVVLARHAATFDQLSDGRLELGLGAGYADSDHRLGATPMWSSGERSERFADAVRVVAALLEGEVPRRGRWWDVPESADSFVATQRPRPPITVAADGARSIDVAARYADRWVSFGGWGLTTEENVAVTRERCEQLDERCAAIGRSPATVGRTLLAGSAAVNVDPIWTSVEAFRDFVGRFTEIGIDLFAFYWPPAAANRSVDASVVERIVAEVIAPSSA